MKPGLKLTEMLSGESNKLRYVKRFGTCHVIHKESVAEHCFYVNFYAFLIAETLVAQDVEVDFRKLSGRALLHDLDEARTGDFNRPFKYSSPALKEALDISAEVAFTQVIWPMVGSGLPPTAQAERLVDYWKNSKAADVEGCIVALADFLSVLSYMLQEIKIANGTMMEQRDTMVAYLKTFDAPQFDFLRQFIQEAAVLVGVLKP